ncbi:hypothetical protein PGT21_001980 [Puccinia graminis f. sp. tritici]|uniref:Uncharacterized protein n=1 Tax=Puccinia graminis f. sp. tritici TaxID=56615 RepID=A0A5B0QS96_PUCGR|nr:hypothetical protein PGT21_001980 [Puccinia graminis f. sp. tritici]KAA1134718.1 hypothetical protein PGTUg99_009420 [Puccinia graminis f. sp. tritici]
MINRGPLDAFAENLHQWDNTSIEAARKKPGSRESAMPNCRPNSVSNHLEEVLREIGHSDRSLCEVVPTATFFVINRCHIGTRNVLDEVCYRSSRVPPRKLFRLDPDVYMCFSESEGSFADGCQLNTNPSIPTRKHPPARDLRHQSAGGTRHAGVTSKNEAWQCFTHLLTLKRGYCREGLNSSHGGAPMRPPAKNFEISVFKFHRL